MARSGHSWQSPTADSQFPTTPKVQRPSRANRVVGCWELGVGRGWELEFGTWELTRGSSYKSPSFATWATAAEREDTSSLDSVFATWRWTVCSLMHSRSAMAW